MSATGGVMQLMDVKGGNPDAMDAIVYSHIEDHLESQLRSSLDPAAILAYFAKVIRDEGG